MRSVTININRRCPLRCRHCMVGFADGQGGSRWRLPAGLLVAMIESLGPGRCGHVLLGGGEPSLERGLVRRAARAGREAGVAVEIISAPVWATSSRRAARFLDGVGELHGIVLSYDRFHLEQLDPASYRTAAAEASARGLQVTMHLSYADPAELPGLRASLLLMARHIDKVSTVPVFPLGNAATLAGGAGARHVRSREDLVALPRTCLAGSAVVDEALFAHACCWSVGADESPLSVPVVEGELGAALAALEARPAVLSVRKRGFLGSLDRAAEREVVGVVGGRAFRSECDVCVQTMGAAGRGVWRAIAASA